MGSNNVVLGGYSWSDIQDMAHVLKNAGVVSYKQKNGNRWENLKRPLSADEAIIVATEAARFGTHPLEMSAIEVKGELVVIPPMHRLYAWENENGGLFRFWEEPQTTTRNEWGKMVEYVSIKVWGIPRRNIKQYQEMFRDTLLLYEGIYDKKEAVEVAKRETFQMLGTMGEGTIKASELGNVNGRGEDFSLRKRADTDLINKAFGRPSPADVAAKMIRAESYAQLPNNWTVEQKQIAADIQAHHNQQLQAPPEKRREQRNNNVKMLATTLYPCYC